MIIVHDECWIFPCNRWLADYEDDGKTERDLYAGGFLYPLTRTQKFVCYRTINRKVIGSTRVGGTRNFFRVCVYSVIFFISWICWELYAYVLQDYELLSFTFVVMID